ncbi:hypothetical protein Aiant_05480 [Actinoplanes ianthinogenes]|uniref:Aminoglycoside phosphotransferase domain-containing protein n=1 Tax=Actinoplanes ianthinogenes TaxID=122358 RepID=A0ABN6C5R6_9ACTN|nr:hypothetical protein Aiant_05480 [Actinoplanes ianthinogenes]
MGLDEGDLSAALAAGWAIEAAAIDYLPVGAGSFHWSVTDDHGRSWFVKVDRDGPDLRRSFATALALHRAGLDVVVAPVPTLDDAIVHPLPRGYAVTVFPLLDGTPGDFGPHHPEDIPEISGILTALHRATPAVADLAPRTDLRLPGRHDLEAALSDLDRPWTSGPHAEPARALLHRHATRIQDWLAEFDRLTEAVRATTPTWVVTHGEPHPGNVLRTPAGPRLIDWTTVRIAPPERDFWMLTTMLGAEPVDLGLPLSPTATALYRRAWILADVAAFTTDLRTPHRDDADTAAALTYLTGYLD